MPHQLCELPHQIEGGQVRDGVDEHDDVGPADEDFQVAEFSVGLQGDEKYGEISLA